MKKNLLEKDEIIHMNCCKYKEYDVNSDGSIYGKEYLLKEVKNIYKRLDVLNDISACGKKLFRLYKNNILWNGKDNYDIEWKNKVEYLQIEWDEKKDKKANEYIIELFEKYGILGDVKESNLDYPCSYITETDKIKLINQIIVIYIINTIRNGIQALYNMGNDEVPQMSEESTKLVKLITNDEVKIDLKNVRIETISTYIPKAIETLVKFTNKYAVLFNRATYKYLQLSSKTEEINYNIGSEDLLQLAFEVFIDISSTQNTNENIFICKQCGKVKEKDGKNQKLCSDCRYGRNKDKVTTKNKEKIISEISSYYHTHVILNMKLKARVKEIINYKSRDIHDITIRELKNILEQLRSQND